MRNDSVHLHIRKYEKLALVVHVSQTTQSLLI